MEPQSDVQSYGSHFESENGLLVELAKTYDVRNIRSVPKLSETWDEITAIFNEKTAQNLSKKQLQKRLTNITYSARKKSNLKTNSKNSRPTSPQISFTPSEIKKDFNMTKNHDKYHSTRNLEQAQLDAEVAKEMAEKKRFEVESLRYKKEEILLQFAQAKLEEAQARAQIASLELQKKQQEVEYQHR